MKFKLFLTLLFCLCFYCSLIGITAGDVSSLILTIFGTIIVVYLKKIYDVLNEIKNK